MARPSRAAEARSTQTRSADRRRMAGMVYKGKLYIDPKSIPTDSVYRWIRESTLNQPDPENVSDRMQNEWRTVPANRHPELPAPADGSNVIRRGGLVLMERSRAIHEEDLEALRQENADVLQSTRWTGLNDDPNTPALDMSETRVVKTRAPRPVDGSEMPIDDFLKG